MRRIIIAFPALVAVIAMTGALGAPSGRSSAGSYSDEVLSRASRMTQEISVPGPLSGHEYHVHGGDEQLRLSSGAGFVREVEAYQAQIDRMLARTRNGGRRHVLSESRNDPGPAPGPGGVSWLRVVG